MKKLDTNIEILQGVGEQKAKNLKNIYGLKTFSDVLHYFPFRHEDKSSIQKIAGIQDATRKVLVYGQVMSLNDVGAGKKRRLIAEISDGTASMELVWFKSIDYIQRYIGIGDKVYAFGKPNFFNKSLTISHPELSKKIDLSQEQALWPIYSTTEAAKNMGLDSEYLAKLSKKILKQLLQEDLPENLPKELIDKYKLCSRFQAYNWIHHPPSEKHYHHALRRLKYEELFWIQLDMARLKLESKKKPSHRFSRVGEYFNSFYQDVLPFNLTKAQKRVIKEIRQDLISGYQMNRLIQGDVGSGKTMVALMSMLLALDNGAQSALMAPTEILAQQHFISFKEYLEPIGLTPVLLTGNTKTAERKAIFEGLKNGEIDIIIGTHALIEPTVEFKNLGLVVIDEQHKFGVAQRAQLSEKNELPPHIMVMTATPIPRSLALTIYGQLDVSQIDELPEGRKPILTKHLMDHQRIEAMRFIREEIRKGRQIYIVYPLIEESEKLDYESLERGYEEIKSYFPDMEYEISLVHGRQDLELRETNMRRFITGQTKILVATTVIEVGVNIPNASVMIIESSERFGLSQLHQLRGRVGRGAEQSYCILMTKSKISEQAAKRITVMTSSNDGFFIAEEDMKLRGPGNMVGTRQSGLPDLRLASIEEDLPILLEAKNSAWEILENDPKLEQEKNKNLKNFIQNSGKKDWSEVL